MTGPGHADSPCIAPNWSEDEWRKIEATLLSMMDPGARLRLEPRPIIAEIPLLPRHGVNLEVMAGNGQKFADAFKATWKRLPLSWRRAVVPYWKQQHPRWSLWGSPWIQLGKGRSFLPQKAMAMVNLEGYRMRFRSTIFDVMPFDVAQDVIAHELAHVMQSIEGIVCVKIDRECGDTYIDNKTGRYWGGNLELEQDADVLTDRAGFDSESVDRWYRETGRAKEFKGTDADLFARVLRKGR